MTISILIVIGLLLTAMLYICCIAAGRADDHGTSTDDTKGENE